MKRDVNLGLLLLIIVSVLLFSGFSVYYQTSFKNVSMEYQNKLNQLGKVTQELTQQRAELNETYSLRIKAETDRKELDRRFQDEKGDREQLETENTNLQLDLTSTKLQLADSQTLLNTITNERDDLLTQRANLQSDLSKANAQISSVKKDLDEVCDFLEGQSLSHSEC